jgi:hypothetical protein
MYFSAVRQRGRDIRETERKRQRGIVREEQLERKRQRGETEGNRQRS